MATSSKRIPIWKRFLATDPVNTFVELLVGFCEVLFGVGGDVGVAVAVVIAVVAVVVVVFCPPVNPPCLQKTHSFGGTPM